MAGMVNCGFPDLSRLSSAFSCKIAGISTAYSVWSGDSWKVMGTTLTRRNGTGGWFARSFIYSTIRVRASLCSGVAALSTYNVAGKQGLIFSILRREAAQRLESESRRSTACLAKST